MPYRSVYQNLNIIVVRIEVRFDQEHIKTLVLLVLTQLSCVAKERCRLFSSKKKTDTKYLAYFLPKRNRHLPDLQDCSGRPSGKQRLITGKVS